MNALKNKYPDFDFSRVTEKDLIYFMRDALSFGVKSVDFKQYEQEILHLLKSRKWNLFAQDIDQNILLTYPVYNNAFEIVDYLMPQYEISKFDKDINNALSACWHLKAEKMFKKVLSLPNLHPQYLESLCLKCGEYSIVTQDNNQDSYINKFNLLLTKIKDPETMFQTILCLPFKDPSININKINLTDFLNKIHPDYQYKASVLEEFFEMFQPEKNTKPIFEAKKLAYDKWILYYQLNENLCVNPSKRNISKV